MAAKRRDDAALCVYVSDIHFPFQCDHALEAVENLIWDQQPEEITQLGDILDCKALGRFVNAPEAPGSLQAEFDRGAAWWGRMRQLAPRAKLRQVQGNHEHRLQRILWETPGLYGIRDLSMQRQLRLEDHGVEWVEEGFEQAPGFWVHHGEIVRSKSGYTATGEMERQGCAGVSGHTHRCGQVFRTDRRGTRTWIEAGYLGDRPKFTYYKGHDWQQGLAYAYVGDGWYGAGVLQVHPGCRIAFGGRIYSPAGVEKRAA